MPGAVGMLSLLSLALVAFAGFTPSGPDAPGPARYLYVWAGTGHHDSAGIAMVAVFDADPASKSYGSVVTVLTVDSAGQMPHHTEFVPPGNATS